LVTVTAHIPDHLSKTLADACGDLNKAVLEGFAVEAYRQGKISCAEVGELLGHASRWETMDFLEAHQAFPGTTVEEVRSDLETLRSLRP
jgi:hypothetical protein